MQETTIRQKSFVQKFTLIWVILLAMGAVFLGVAIVMQLIPMEPSSITVTVNGVRQPSTEQTVRSFRLIFLLAFGLCGLAMAVTGFIIALRTAGRGKQARQLKEDGVCLTAQVLEAAPAAVRINNRALVRLRCSFTQLDGTVLIFKSDLLRVNPMPYLPDGQVKVYHDRHNMRRYFVDVDGSAGLGTRVVEL